MMRTLLRRFDRFRRDNTEALARWAFRLLGRDRFLLDERLTDDQVRRILVLRNNKRIGNMYFMLPFLNGLRRAYPDAVIELMVINTQQAAIFKHLDIDRVIVSDFSFYTAWQFIKVMREHRRHVYDLLIMPHSSASDTIIGGLIHARNKIAFWGDETSGVYRHSFDVKPNNPHAALSALTLIDELGHRQAETPNHQMVFSDEESVHARELVAKFRGQADYCFAYFRGARGNKIVPDADWARIRKLFDAALDGQISWVEILSPDIRSPLTEGTRTFESADLRQLGCFLKHCNLFICADTGPLHLADAAGARCVGLFTATPIEHYGCLGKQTVNVQDLAKLDANEILTKLIPHRFASGSTA